MIGTLELNSAIAQAALHHEKRKTYDSDTQNAKMNTVLVEMFTTNKIFTSRDKRTGKLFDGKCLSRMRIRKRLWKQKAFTWSFDDVLQWLIENWVEILKILVSILIFFI